MYWRIVQFLKNEISFVRIALCIAEECTAYSTNNYTPGQNLVGGDWLTDEYMFYAQELLRMQFPTMDGWQSTLLAQNNGFLPAKMDAIQIHIVSDSHRVTSARLVGTVTPFVCRKVGSHMSSTLTHQLCQVYRTSICESGGNSFLAVNVATVQKQRCSDDCGVFAIVFALHAALGDEYVLASTLFHLVQKNGIVHSVHKSWCVNELYLY